MIGSICPLIDNAKQVYHINGWLVKLGDHVWLWAGSLALNIYIYIFHVLASFLLLLLLFP
jgi:hypothetical protein